MGPLSDLLAFQPSSLTIYSLAKLVDFQILCQGLLICKDFTKTAHEESSTGPNEVFLFCSVLLLLLL